MSNLYNNRATRIDFETIEKLCDLFNCTVSELFNHTNKEKNSEK
ncbi:helix-turn-helix domain-containing protein [Rothia sp. CCM 9418]